MSKLPSLSYREVAEKLKRAGFVYVRAGKHDVYANKARNVTIPLPRHSFVFRYTFYEIFF